ncbi:alpha/beta fold hydrolase [Pseudonocardia bannensis]|uniref:Alpha/beta hydrolase n=1 Tax=Pseudonocardia bannensis TaxID=630973 RepID=A0A848DGN5_9PSEU|nr:alpha/beta hydrolase family protein [Pseudonocardia bannensis]NMH91807.1 alpha/beta hydrolase [Pseudonocardia bannensis]
MTGFVLVHGAWHAGSCWAGVAAELTARGHQALAVDLPADKPGLGAGAYADTVLDAVATLPDAEPLVLVGHSLGGLTVPVVAERLGPERVRALVLVAALVPRPGLSYNDQLRADRSIMAPGFGVGQERHEDGTTSWSAAAAVSGLYRYVDAEVPADEVGAAVGRLRRQAWDIGREITPLTAWPAVRTVSVVCADDRVVDAGWSRRAAAEIGAEVVELAGGHFPMLTRPAELSDVLVAAGG